MNADTGRFSPISEEQEKHLLEFPYEKTEDSFTGSWRRAGIKQAQIFRVGEVVEIKGANYRVKAIHTNSITFER